MSSFFSRNEGTVDRVLRGVFGIGLLSLVFVGPQTPWGWLGLIFVVTAALGTCPIYSVLGINTCPVRER